MSKTTQEQIVPLCPREVRVKLAIKGWSQRQLAQKVNASTSSTSNAINHNENPNVVKRIKKILAL